MKVGDKLIQLDRVIGNQRLIEILKVNKKSLRINRDIIYKDGTKVRTDSNYYYTRAEFDFLYTNKSNVVKFIGA